MLSAFYEAVLPSQGSYALFLWQNKRHVWASSIDELVAQTEKRIDTPNLYFATASFVAPTERTINNALSRRAFCFDIDAGPEKVAKHGDKVYETQADAIAAVTQWCGQNKILPRYMLSSGAGLHVYFALDSAVSIADWLPVATALKAMALGQGLRIDAGVTADPARVLRPPGTLHHSGERVTVLGELPKVYSLAELTARVAAFVPVAAPRRERARSINDDILSAPSGPPKSLQKLVRHCAAMSHAVQSKGNVAEPYWRAMLGVIKYTFEGEAAAHEVSSGHPDYDYDDTQTKLDRWTAGPALCGSFENENPQACAKCPHKGRIRSPIALGSLTDADVAALHVASPPPTPVAVQTAVEAPLFQSSLEDDDEDLGRALDVQPATRIDPWGGCVPDRFRIAAALNGYVMVARQTVKQVDPTGATISVDIDTAFCSIPFWFESWAPGTNDNDQALAIYCAYDVARHTVSRFTLPTRTVAQRETLFAVLASQNIQVYPSAVNSKNAMEDYVKASLERIRHAGQRQKIADRFGTMFTDRGDLVVAQGQHIINADGSIFEGVVQEKLRQRGAAYRVALPVDARGRWDADVWDSYILPRARRHIEYLNEFYSEENFQPYQLAIMLAWASPMLAFVEGRFHAGSPLPGIGLTVSLYSARSGIGKTAAMHAAALAFGAPTALCLQLDGNNSTGNARQALLEQSGTMPSFMDEMEAMEPKDLANLISAVGNGASKKRLNKDLALVGGEPTALINIMSTNKSHRELALADRSESAAVQMRLLEIDCTGVQPVSRQQGLRETEARSKLHDCAGAVGAIIHRAMCTLGAEKLNALGIECADKARQHMEGQQDGRFMWRALGAMLAVRRILAQSGLKAFDGPQLIAEFRKWHDAGYEFSESNVLPPDGPSVLSQLLRDYAGQTLITRDETHRNPKDPSKIDIPLNERPVDAAVARSVLNGRYVYITSDAIRDWCMKRRISPNGLIKRCGAAGVFERNLDTWATQYTRQIDLYKGTKLSQGVRSSVYKVLIARLGTDIDYAPTDNVVEIRPRDEAVSLDQTLSSSASA